MSSTLRGAIGLTLALTLSSQAWAADRRIAAPRHANPAIGSYLLTPDIIIDERGRSLNIERGLLFVPENRNAAGSRTIAVHFTRFPARQRSALARPPVFLLPGGPGWDFDFTDPLVFDEIERLRNTRDVISVSQRGYVRAPGLTPNLRVSFPGGAPEVYVSARRRAEADRDVLAAAYRTWQARGVDLSGYDIMNITDDVNDLRVALGFGKIVLRGCSFGSQWSLAYMARWPKTVDRAMLSGVEPLDYGYDSPQWIWASLSRVAKAAEADAALAPSIPPGGLMAALVKVIERLEAAPVVVTIRAPSGPENLHVTVGADDLRGLLTDLNLGRRRSLENLSQWPQFILEMYNGDYRFLAARAAEARTRGRSESLLLALINHSVGVSAERAAQLRAEPAAAWLGDINLKESLTRGAAPTPEVNDAFRRSARIKVPTLLIAGDYDWSTPIENAAALLETMDSGHLAKIEGGRHCTETNFGELASQAPEATKTLYDFIDADFEQESPSRVLARLPASVSLAPIKFAPPSERTLYEEWLAKRR